MKIAYFTNYVPHYRKDVFETLGAMENINFDVYASYKYKGGFNLIKPEGASNFNYYNSVIFRLNLYFATLFYQPIFVLKLLKRSYDVYIVSYSRSNLSVWIGLILAKITNQKVLLWGHGNINNKIDFLIKRFMLKLSSGVLFYDDRTRNKWLNKRVNKNKLFVAYNSVNTVSIFKIKNQINKSQVSIFCKRHNAVDTQNIIFSGRLQKRRNLEVLFNAIEILKNQKYNIKLFVIGDGPEKSHLLKIIDQKKLNGHINLLGVLYNEYEIAQVFLASKCAVIPGWVGLFVQHSFSYGLPVIIGDDTSQHGPEASLVTNKVTGLIFKHDDPNDLAKAILNIICNDNFRTYLSSNASKLIYRKYNAKNMANGFYKAISYAQLKN